MIARDRPSAVARTGARPTGAPRVPPGPKPELRAECARAIRMCAQGGKDCLSFSADVWNAGGSPLVVEGFRRSGGDVMDAYQYFYDAEGVKVGYAPAGTMEWDPRDGHRHWHFPDFAACRLLGADRGMVVRRQRETFSLDDTDSVTLFVENADGAPDLPGGDAYVQTLSEQSFDVTDLPNGRYHIQVIVNPDRRLYEAGGGMSSALREIILDGEQGARTVIAP